MNILSIQSHVTYGYVGNSIAVFALQRLGIQVWPIHTVAFSNHTGYSRWTGQVFDAHHIDALVSGLEHQGLLENCDAVLSGYLGSLELGQAVLEVVARVRAANPKALFACDPVMGDRNTGFYVREDIPDFFANRAVPLADIISPNQFELEVLAGDKLLSRDETISAARKIASEGSGQSSRIDLVTSLEFDNNRSREIEMLAVAPSGTWQLCTPFLEVDPLISGTGDLVSALFLANYLKSEDVALALSQAGSAVYEVLAATHRAGQKELCLIEAQDSLVAPGRQFQATRLA